MDYIVSREGLGYSVKGKLDERNSDTLKTVIRQHWKDKLTEVEKTKGKHISTALDTHLSNMTAIIDPIDYEAFCIPNIIQHSKHMQKEDFSTYLKLIESMALGYSNHVGKDLASLILIGVTTKGRSIGSIERYLGLLISSLNGKVIKYQGRISKRTRKIEILSGKLKLQQASILRFFRKRRINRITNNITLTTHELQILNERMQRYNSLIAQINAVKSRPPSKP